MHNQSCSPETLQKKIGRNTSTRQTRDQAISAPSHRPFYTEIPSEKDGSMIGADSVITQKLQTM